MNTTPKTLLYVILATTLTTSSIRIMASEAGIHFQRYNTLKKQREQTDGKALQLERMIELLKTKSLAEERDPSEQELNPLILLADEIINEQNELKVQFSQLGEEKIPGFSQKYIAVE